MNSPLLTSAVADELKAIGCELGSMKAGAICYLLVIRGCEQYIVEDEDGMRRLVTKLKSIPAR